MNTGATARIMDEIVAIEERLDALKRLAHAPHNQHLAQLEDNLRYRMIADPWNDSRPLEDGLNQAPKDRADAV